MSTLPSFATAKDYAGTYTRGVVAFAWRRLLSRQLRVVAISGSNGKTTAKDALGRILSARKRIIQTAGSHNSARRITRILLALRPNHDAAVLELGISRPGQMRKYTRLCAPDVAVLTRVSSEHEGAIGGLDDIAREKAQLLTGLRPGGVAILNADDPYVSKMRPPAGRRVVTFGRGAQCDVRAEEVRSAWPGTLSFRVRAGEETAVIRTKLIGEHWIYSLTAAVAAAHELGVSLVDAADALEGFEPHHRRLQPIALPNGATLIRDDGIATVATLEVAAQVLASSTAKNSWLMMGDGTLAITDPVERARWWGDWIGSRVQSIVFVGENAHHAAAAAEAAGAERVRYLETIEQAVDFLRALGPGDMAILKARRLVKLDRVVFRLFGEVDCRIPHCEVTTACDFCDQLGFEPGPNTPDNVAWSAFGADSAPYVQPQVRASS